MKWKEFLRDYFVFTRKERIGLLVVILIMVGIWIFPKVSRPVKPRIAVQDTSWVTAAKQLMIRRDSGSQSKNSADSEDELAYAGPLSQPSNESKVQLFYFDPNTLSFAGWKKLGVREKTIATIQNYLNKGGHFQKAEDLKKIYGIRPDEYLRLQPYVRIANIVQSASPSPEKADHKSETLSSGSGYAMIDINRADTSAFVALPGIGNKLASRIVNFRDKLGGFYSTDQISEIYGLPDSAFQKIKPFLKLETGPVKKININSATKDEMKSHPYIKWNLANAIVEYRNQHGNFSSVEDLKKISVMTTDLFDKIKFYLTL
jgi:competence ComEA-like helix-hairpin-helix protein